MSAATAPVMATTDKGRLPPPPFSQLQQSSPTRVKMEKGRGLSGNVDKQYNSKAHCILKPPVYVLICFETIFTNLNPLLSLGIKHEPLTFAVKLRKFPALQKNAKSKIIVTFS